MAAVASLSCLGGGRWRVQFEGVDGSRRSIALSGLDRRAAEAFRSRVASLRGLAMVCEASASALSRWAASLPDETYGALAGGGLVPARVVGASRGGVTCRGVDPCSMTAADVDVWVGSLSHLSRATVSRMICGARSMARRAGSTAFDHLRPGPQTNPGRMRYVESEAVWSVVRVCRDPELRLVLALARWCGLRCPSEPAALCVSDVDLARGRLTVRSSKTGAVRVVPIAPGVAPLLASFRPLGPGSHYRAQASRAVRRAGLEPWPRIFHNLRSSCAVDWSERFPAHVVAGWMGHSLRVCERHYLHVRDANFRAAAGDTP